MKRIVLIVAFGLLSEVSLCQLSIRGIISDENNRPIQGVTITVKETSTKTQSDKKGNYTISVPYADCSLVFSKIEYLTQEIKIANSNLNVVMSIIDVFDLSIEELMQINVVTASRSEIQRDRIPATTYIISRKEIINNNYSTLTEALKTIPEIKVSQPGSAECGNLFIMRGMLGNYYTKILIDGIPITPSVVSGIAIDEQINMKNIERIEVVYGPASAIYGADAVSGAINIITLKPSKNTVNVETSIGTKGYLHTNLLASYILGNENSKLQLVAYGIYSKRNDRNIKSGYDTIYEREQYPQHASNKIPFVLGKIPNDNGSFGLLLSGTNFTLAYDFMHRSEFSSLGQRTDYFFYDDPNARLTENIQRVAFTHKASLNNVFLNTNFSFLHYRMDNSSYFSTIYSNKDPLTYGYVNKSYKFQASDDFLFEEVLVWNPLKTLEFVGGFSFQFSGAFPKTNDLETPFNENDYKPFSTKKPPLDPFYRDFGYNPIVYNNLAGFLQGVYSTPRFTFMGGARYDIHSEYGSSINPRVAVQVSLFKHTYLRASFNKAFKAPSPYYSYQSIASASPTQIGYVNYINVPNKNLRSEKLTSYEVGLRQLFTENTSVELIGFYNHIFDLISIKSGLYSHDLGYTETAYFTDRVSIYTNEGNAEATIKGLGVIFRAKDIIPSIKLSTDLYINYFKGKETFPSKLVIVSGDTSIVNDKIDNRRMLPNWIGKARIYCYPLNKLYVAFDNFLCTDWYSRQVNSLVEYEKPNNKIKGYYTLDANLFYDLSKNLKLLAKIENAFNTKHGGIQAYDSFNLIYNPQPGRCFYGGLILTF
jgi:hemoglobin/transferrin/lactoferrin receptor protein